MLLGHGQHRMEWQAVAGGIIGFFQTPGFSGLAQNLDKRFKSSSSSGFVST